MTQVVYGAILPLPHLGYSCWSANCSYILQRSFSPKHLKDIGSKYQPSLDMLELVLVDIFWTGKAIPAPPATVPRFTFRWGLSGNLVQCTPNQFPQTNIKTWHLYSFSRNRNTCWVLIPQHIEPVHFFPKTNLLVRWDQDKPFCSGREMSSPAHSTSGQSICCSHKQCVCPSALGATRWVAPENDWVRASFWPLLGNQAQF